MSSDAVARNKSDTPPKKPPRVKTANFVQIELLLYRCIQTPLGECVLLFVLALLDTKTMVEIGTKQVEFYEVSSRTNYEGFQVHVEIAVQRRFSEFQTLHAVLAAKGVKPLSLSWFQWVPKNISRWEELNNFVEHLATLSRNFNDECIEELKRFCQDKSPYQAQEEHNGLGTLRRLFV